MTHKGTVTLETERLTLRRFSPSDTGAMFRNWAGENPEIARYLAYQPDGTFQTISEWIAKYDFPKNYNWAIVLKEIDEPIGYINAHDIDDLCKSLEVGYAIGFKWWHLRIATEALKAVIKFFFEEVKVNRIAAKHRAGNPRSGGVMLNCGMKKEGVLRQASKTGEDMVLYAVLAEDFYNSSQ